MKQTFKTIALATITLGTAITFTACDQANTCKYDEASNTLSCSEKTYKTANLGGKVWMAENIAAYIPDSSVCYGNEHVNCEIMGRLYTWNAATTGLCPKGWTLPSQEDFKKAFGDASSVTLKENSSFNMQFAGFRYYDGKFADKGASASFWTSDSYDDSRAYLVRATDSIITYEHFNKSIAASVRCVKE
jgi:Fibrobacter succinogenes major domain (Fib_succ_major).